MAIVIDAKDILDNKKELPTEAFFVDTNIVILFKDPFGSYSQSSYREKEAEEIQKILHEIRSRLQLNVYSTRSIALEYYKYIQNGSIRSYNLVNNANYLPLQLKELRRDNQNFAEMWELRMKEFLKTFRKNFPIFKEEIDGTNILSDFNFENMDFGDHLLYKTVINCEPENRCIFSNDADFYSISDDLFLLTTNSKVIKQAGIDGKLFQ